LLIAQEASEWFVANREEPLSARKSAEFSHWLKSSPLHIEEYLAVAQLAKELQATRDPTVIVEKLVSEAQLERAIFTAPFDHVAPSRERRHPPRWLPFATAAAIAASALIAYLTWDWQPRSSTPQHYVTAHGQQATYYLADNSILRLNTDTAVVVNYGANERVVEIVQGQAMFEVIHNPKRPFRVAAGSAEVQDLGTAFEVYRQGNTTRVTVVDGQVGVAPSKSLVGRLLAAWNVRVSSGEQVQIVAGVLTRAPEAVDLGRSTAWLRRQIAFERQPLGQVAEEFNRYNLTPIHIETPALRDLKVSGVFAADDTESFIAFLRSLDGVNVEVRQASIDVRAR